MNNDRWLDIQRHDSERRRHQENGARQASCFVQYTVRGAGEIIVAEAETFHTPFFGEPSVTFGHWLQVTPDLDAYYLPRVTGGVFRWEIEGKDRHVGMFPYFTVDVETRPGVEDPPSLDPITIVAYLTFTGMSYKAMGETVTSKLEDSAIPARDVPMIP